MTTTLASTRLRVVLMGNFSAYPFLEELGLRASDIRRITSWNETLAFALARLPQLEVHFITRYGRGPVKQVKRDGLCATYLSAPKWLNAATLFHWTSWQAQRLIRRLCPDLVHGIGTEHIWPCTALGSRYPHVITLHGVASEIARRTGAPKLSLLRYFAALEQRVVRRARNFIAISPYVEEWLRARTQARVYRVENPVHERYFGVQAHPDASRTLLFVGHSGRGKGLGTLAEALALLRPRGLTEGWKVQVFGPVKDDEYHQQTKAILKRNGLIQQVEFQGFALPDTLARAYGQAAALVLPSQQETAPMCVAEAMACGVPVLATAVGGIPHMVAEGENGCLFPVGDARGLAGHLEALMRDPGWRGRLGARGKALAERWRPERIAAQTAEVYRQVGKR